MWIIDGLSFHISKYHTIGYRYSPCVFKQIQKCENEVIKNSPVYTGKLSVQPTSRLWGEAQPCPDSLGLPHTGRRDTPWHIFPPKNNSRLKQKLTHLNLYTYPSREIRSDSCICYYKVNDKYKGVLNGFYCWTGKSPSCVTNQWPLFEKPGSLQGLPTDRQMVF